MKKLIPLLLIILLGSSLSANDDIKRHGLSVHAGGTSSLYEFEYQYNFLIKDQHILSANIGINTLVIAAGFPLGVNYTYGSKNRFLLGFRFMPLLILDLFDEIENDTVYLLNLRIGYGREIRLFNEKHLLSFYFSPSYDIVTELFPLWAGIGLTHYF